MSGSVLATREPERYTQQLLCPGCGFNYVHHGRVIVRTREAEDADGLAVTVFKNGTSKVERGLRNGFVGRRGDIEIEFTCENGCSFVLTIVQHKGNSFISSDAGRVVLEDL